MFRPNVKAKFSGQMLRPNISAKWLGQMLGQMFRSYVQTKCSGQMFRQNVQAKFSAKCLGQMFGQNVRAKCLGQMFGPLLWKPLRANIRILPHTEMLSCRRTVAIERDYWMMWLNLTLLILIDIWCHRSVAKYQASKWWLRRSLVRL